MTKPALLLPTTNDTRVFVSYEMRDYIDLIVVSFWGFSLAQKPVLIQQSEIVYNIALLDVPTCVSLHITNSSLLCGYFPTCITFA